MSESELFKIVSREDGLFDVVTTVETALSWTREGLASLAAAEAYVEGLKVMMTGLGATLGVTDEGEI